KFKAASDKFNAAAKTLTDAEAELKKAELPKSTAEHELQLATKAAARTETAVTEAKSAIESAERYKKQSETEAQAAKKVSFDLEKPIPTIAFSSARVLCS